MAAQSLTYKHTNLMNSRIQPFETIGEAGDLFPVVIHHFGNGDIQASCDDWKGTRFRVTGELTWEAARERAAEEGRIYLRTLNRRKKAVKRATNTRKVLRGLIARLRNVRHYNDLNVTCPGLAHTGYNPTKPWEDRIRALWPKRHLSPKAAGIQTGYSKIRADLVAT